MKNIIKRISILGFVVLVPACFSNSGYVEYQRIVFDGKEYAETEKVYLSIAKYKYTDGANYLTNYDGYFYMSLKANYTFEKDIVVDTATTSKHYHATLVSELGIFATYRGVYYSKEQKKIKLVDYTNKNLTKNNDSELDQKLINPVWINENRHYILVGKAYTLTKDEVTNYIDAEPNQVECYE